MQNTSAARLRLKTKTEVFFRKTERNRYQGIFDAINDLGNKYCISMTVSRIHVSVAYFNSLRHRERQFWNIARFMHSFWSSNYVICIKNMSNPFLAVWLIYTSFCWLNLFWKHAWKIVFLLNLQERSKISGWYFLWQDYYCKLVYLLRSRDIPRTKIINTLLKC